jgi:hypothetical protein
MDGQREISATRTARKIVIRSACLVALCVVAIACNANTPATPGASAASASAAPRQTSTTPAAANSNPYAKPIKTASKNSDTAMDDLHSFATNGNKILASKTGDLNGDGKPDALLVLDPATTGDEKLGEGPARRVLILIRDANGQLQKVAQNDKLVPCAQCGGIAGDPFSYVQISANGFTVVTEGGSREHWSNEYTFTYSAQHTDWLLSNLKREVTDQDSGKNKKIDLLPKDFGVVTFANFDPATQPKVELP